MAHKTGGFECKKYKIEKSDGTPLDSGAKYFVMRYDTDPNALVALQVYASCVIMENEEFGNDLLEEITNVIVDNPNLLVAYMAISKAYKEKYHPEEAEDEREG